MQGVIRVRVLQERRVVGHRKATRNSLGDLPNAQYAAYGASVRGMLRLLPSTHTLCTRSPVTGTHHMPILVEWLLFSMADLIACLLEPSASKCNTRNTLLRTPAA
jgi:hypothetical protein